MARKRPEIPRSALIATAVTGTLAVGIGLLIPESDLRLPTVITVVILSAIALFFGFVFIDEYQVARAQGMGRFESCRKAVWRTFRTWTG